MSKKSLTCLFVPLLILLYVTGCSTAEEILYDITGNWRFTLSTTSGQTDTINITLVGTESEGTVTDNTRRQNGTYTVDKSTVNITIVFHAGAVCGEKTEMIKGTINSATSMSGTFEYSYSGGCTEDNPWISWEAAKIQ